MLIIVLVVAIGVHVAPLAAGGQWPRVAMILIAVDVVGLLFVLGAIRAFKKLDEREKP